MKPEVKIQFSDFWDDFNPEDNFITDALKKNFTPVLSDCPDFVFCGTFGRKHLKYSCAKIFFTGENLLPDFNLVDYGIGFHDISFGDRYLRYPLYALYEEACKKGIQKHTRSDEEYLAHKKFCNFVISNAIADPARDEMMDLLSKIAPLDSGGRYRNNVGGPVPDKIAFERDYRFTMCFENTCSPGYTTEKLMEAFAGDTIPIYWGNPDVAREFNPKAFINCHDYESLSDVAAAVEKIWQDDTLYLQMMKEPILGAEENLLAAQYLKEEYLADYLNRICSQAPDKAIRRNRLYQGRRYEEQAAFHQKIDRVLYYPRRVLFYIQNKIRAKK